MSPPTAAQRAEIAAFAGVTADTVQRWFTSAGTQRNLIPLSMAGAIPVTIQSTNTQQIYARVAVGLLLTGGASGDLYTKKDYSKSDTYESLTEIVEHFSRVTRDPFLISGIKSYTIEEFEGGWGWSLGYASPAEGEYVADYVWTGREYDDEAEEEEE